MCWMCLLFCFYSVKVFYFCYFWMLVLWLASYVWNDFFFGGCTSWMSLGIWISNFGFLRLLQGCFVGLIVLGNFLGKEKKIICNILEFFFSLVLYEICLCNFKAGSKTRNLHIGFVFRDCLNVLELCEDWVLGFIYLFIYVCDLFGLLWNSKLDFASVGFNFSFYRLCSWFFFFLKIKFWNCRPSKISDVCIISK